VLQARLTLSKSAGGGAPVTGEITTVARRLGTFVYMSPGQMVGGQVTGQTDIYTLGIVMYEMIAGTRPFPESATAGAALAAMLKTTPEPLYLRAPVPRLLDAIVMRCLERETTKRYRSVAQLREDLERIGSEDGASANTATMQVGKELVDKALADNDDETAITPPPEKIKTPVRPKSAPEWDDVDEHLPTSTRRPDGSDDMRATPTPALQRPEKRPLPGRHIDTPPVPQLVVAPFSSSPRVRSNTGQVPHSPAEAALGIAPTAVQPAVNARQVTRPPMRPSPLPSGPPPGVPWHHNTPTSGSHGALPSTGVPRAAQGSPASGPHGVPVTGPHQAAPQAAPLPVRTSPSGPYGNPFTNEPGSGRIKQPTIPPGPSFGTPFNAPPVSQPPPTALTTTSQGHAPARALVTPPPPLGAGLPPTPAPGYLPQTPLPPRPPTAAYDMGKMAASDTMVRRIVWIIVLLVAAGVGFVVASQL